MPPTGRKRRKKEDVEGEGEGAGGTTTNRSAKGNGSRAGQATKKERRESTTTTEYESQQQGMQDHEPEFVSMGYSGGARTMGSISVSWLHRLAGLLAELIPYPRPVWICRLQIHLSP